LVGTLQKEKEWNGIFWLPTHLDKHVMKSQFWPSQQKRFHDNPDRWDQDTINYVKLFDTVKKKNSMPFSPLSIMGDIEKIYWFVFWYTVVDLLGSWEGSTNFSAIQIFLSKLNK